jgi:hypothetical protein
MRGRWEYLQVMSLAMGESARRRSIASSGACESSIKVMGIVLLRVAL